MSLRVQKKMPTPPALTADQRRQAYEYSLRLRRARAEVKAQLRAGTMTLREALADPDTRGMKVRQLLLALPGVAARRADRALEYANIDSGRTVARCGVHQLERLIDYVNRLPTPN